MKQKFLNIFSEYFENSKLSKLIVSSPLQDSEFRSIIIRPFLSKKGHLLSWVYRYPRKDVTKNYTLDESLALLQKMIGVDFKQFDLYGLEQEVFLKADGKEKMTQKPVQMKREVQVTHNKVKSRMVESDANFLKLLGVSSTDGHLKKEKRDKFVQINKFLEFFKNATESLEKNKMTVLDMGSGKGYLTFAIYHYLKEVLSEKPEVKGVEFREDMVHLCNQKAAEAGFDGLGFVQGSIDSYEIPSVDVLIALHACDTATDDALAKGIRSGAKVIMVSPCCHKQVRKSMKTAGLASWFSKYGIVEERTAEMLTDLIRAEVLEIFGYQTQVFEFVNAENSPKNLMITAVKKRENRAEDQNAWMEIEKIKAFYGVEYQHLEREMRT